MQIYPHLDNNIYLGGIAMLLINIGSKYVMIDIPKGLEQLLKHIFFRRLILFSIFYLGTKDLILSLGLTAIFIVLSNSIFNEESKYCLLTKNVKDTKITELEYTSAMELINKYKLQNENLKSATSVKDEKIKSNYVKIKEVIKDIVD